jgi:hypothetical protein
MELEDQYNVILHSLRASVCAVTGGGGEGVLYPLSSFSLYFPAYCTSEVVQYSKDDCALVSAFLHVEWCLENSLCILSLHQVSLAIW